MTSHELEACKNPADNAPQCSVAQVKAITRFALNKLPPFAVVLAGMVVAFFVFLFLDWLEEMTFPGYRNLSIRPIHLVRGFLATAGGMLLVWMIMRRKEVELLRLRDHFADQLLARTEELVHASTLLQIEKQRVESILASMGEGLLEVDEDGIVQLANPRAEQILGLDCRQLIGMGVTELSQRMTTFDDKPVPSNFIVANGDGHIGALCKESWYEQSDGHRLAISWTTSPLVSSSGCMGTVVTFLDCSKRVELENGIRQQRDDFISALKHNLKTPVLATQRSAGLLLSGEFGGMTDAQITIVSLLADGATKLSRLIEDLVEIYRYQNYIKHLDIRSQPVLNMLQETEKIFSPQAIAKQLSIEVSVESRDLNLKCDGAEIKTLIEHLLENAIEHARSYVKIGAYSDSNNGQVVLYVEDDGRGIGKEDQNLLFEHFYERSSSGRHSATTGVGLCLCHQIAKAHGGKIACHSIVGHRTRFEVTIPAGEGNCC